MRKHFSDLGVLTETSVRISIFRSVCFYDFSIYVVNSKVVCLIETWFIGDFPCSVSVVMIEKIANRHYEQNFSAWKTLTAVQHSSQYNCSSKNLMNSGSQTAVFVMAETDILHQNVLFVEFSHGFIRHCWKIDFANYIVSTLKR